MHEIDVGRGTENGAAKLAAVFGLSTKTHRGGAFGPPIGAHVNPKSNLKIERFTFLAKINGITISNFDVEVSRTAAH